MNEADKMLELANILQAERDKQVNAISAGAAQRGAGLAGPNGAVGIYNQDRFIRPTVEPLVTALVTKAKQAALQEQLKQLADAATSRYQKAYSNYASRRFASQPSSGGSPQVAVQPGDNTVNIVDAPVVDPSAYSNKVYSDGSGGTYGYQASGPNGQIGSAVFSTPISDTKQITNYLPGGAGLPSVGPYDSYKLLTDKYGIK